jgi:hypothetical protein
MFGCYREQSDAWYIYTKGKMYMEKELEITNNIRAVRGLKKENKYINLEEVLDEEKTLIKRDDNHAPINTSITDVI